MRTLFWDIDTHEVIKEVKGLVPLGYNSFVTINGKVYDSFGATYDFDNETSNIKVWLNPEHQNL